MSSKLGSKSEPNSYKKALNILKTNEIPSLSLLMGIFEPGTMYKGNWLKLPYPDGASPSKKGFYLFQNSGKSKVEFSLQSEN